jgi:hypothetical protein
VGVSRHWSATYHPPAIAMCDGASEECEPNEEGEVCALRPYRPKEDNNGLSTATFALG